MEYQRISNLLDATSDNVPGFINKKWVGVHDQSSGAEDRYIDTYQANKKDLKHQSYDQNYVILVMHIVLLKEMILFQNMPIGF